MSSGNKTQQGLIHVTTNLIPCQKHRFNLPIKKNVTKLLSLNDQYGTSLLIWAIRKALCFNAYGAEYIENILYQNSSPPKNHPPVRLKDDQLNTITLTQPCLANYDAHILKKDKKS